MVTHFVRRTALLALMAAAVAGSTLSLHGASTAAASPANRMVFGVAPTSGAPNSCTRVAGQGYDHGQTVRVLVYPASGPNQLAHLVTKETTVDGNGRFEVNVAIPSSAHAGETWKVGLMPLRPGQNSNNAQFVAQGLGYDFHVTGGTGACAAAAPPPPPSAPAPALSSGGPHYLFAYEFVVDAGNQQLAHARTLAQAQQQCANAHGTFTLNYSTSRYINGHNVPGYVVTCTY